MDDAGKWTADDLAETARGFRLPVVLLALVRAGVIGALCERPAGPAALAAACGVHEGALVRMLNVLVSVGILDLAEGAYSLRVDPGDHLESMRHAADGLDKWLSLPDVLSRGHAEFPDELDVTLDPERNERFIRAMYAHAGPVAGRLARVLPREGAMSFLDLGGGPGTFCFALLEAWDGLVATLADLPLTLRVTRRLVDEKGAGDRMRLVEADFYHDRGCDLGGPYDLALVSAVIHAEGEDENRDLLARARRVVSTGGRILVRETLLDESRLGPTRAALFDVHMLVSTRRGRCYTLAEISDMLEGAGFRRPRLLAGPEEGIVVADG
jgi:ubiquinone/menaquinone biosynthesis C-methylase UbiE